MIQPSRAPMRRGPAKKSPSASLRCGESVEHNTKGAGCGACPLLFRSRPSLGRRVTWHLARLRPSKRLRPGFPHNAGTRPAVAASVHRRQEPFHHLEKRLRLLDVRHVARLLEELPARAWDARVDLLDDVRRRFVAPA